jgi:hypothetical protein
LPDDEALIDELANLRLRETSPGVLRIDHLPDKHDDRGIALALAAYRLARKPLLQPEAPEKPEIADPRRRHLIEMIERDREYDQWSTVG